LRLSNVNRIQVVLAETANDLKVGGHTTWDQTDFYTASQKFVQHLYAVVLMAEDIGITTERQTYDDMMDNLEWDVPDSVKSEMIEACLDELYAEFTQEN
jgi:hypothetical protein